MDAPDLYATLNVARDADTATIQRAYRKAAARTHPDAGGTIDAFVHVQVALKVLTDQRARAHYDRTGAIEPPGPDNEESQILNAAATALMMAIDKGNVDTSDIVGEAVQSLKYMLSDVGQKIRAHEDAIKKLKTALRRISRRKLMEVADDWAPRLINAQWGHVERALYSLRVDRERLEKAIELLRGYEYKRDPPRY